MNFATHFECIECGETLPFEKNSITYLCPCGGNLEISYDYGKLRKTISKETLRSNCDFSLWRYKELYPLEQDCAKSPLQAGWTPLYTSPALAKYLRLKTLYLKDEGRNPSGSLKDRAGSIALAAALERNLFNITGASTGNAGSSMACLCASLGISPVIFVPYKAPKAKIAQLLLYGAKVLMVEGTYDQAFDLCLEFSQKFGWFNRNTGYNPFTREGKKSCSFEICEQLGWNVPDWVFVSVGDGNIISGLWKGFSELKKIGLISSLPKLCAVQSDKSNSIAISFKNHQAGKIEIIPVSATTLADSISVDLPRDGICAVKSIIESGGTAIEVTDEEIIDAIKTTAHHSGVFAEPAGAACVAGLKKMLQQGLLSEESTAVCVITGNGLKDIDSALKASGTGEIIKPTIDAAVKALKL